MRFLEEGQTEVVDYSLDTRVPCRLTVEATGPSAEADLDLYVVLGESEPTLDRYDLSSTGLGSGERVRLDRSDLADVSTVGVLVHAVSGGGRVDLGVTERGRRWERPGHDGPLRLRSVNREPDWGSWLGSLFGADGHDGVEHVVVENPLDRAVDLSGYALSDAVGHTFAFGDQLLPAGDRVLVRTDDARNRAGGDTLVLNWDDRNVWTDSGDTVTLTHEGRVVDRLVYGGETDGVGLAHVRPLGDDETVVVENASDRARGLRGYRVEDDAGNSYRLGDWTLPSGWTLTLSTGHGRDCREPGEENLLAFWGREEPVWDDDGGVVRLVDDGGLPVDRLRYGDHREYDGRLEIDDFRFPAGGRRQTVVLQNVGDDPVFLAGYELASDGGPAYEFGDLGLDPFETVALVVGAEDDDVVEAVVGGYGTATIDADHYRYWGRRNPAWEDDGDDSVSLVSPGGEVVDGFDIPMY